MWQQHERRFALISVTAAGHAMLLGPKVYEVKQQQRHLLSAAANWALHTEAWILS